jgi:hypothetical protein
MFTWKTIRQILPDSKPTRKDIKMMLSITGATMLLGTFIVKDVREDKAKELVASINTAENVFISRTAERRIYDQMKQFESEFLDYRENPSKPDKWGDWDDRKPRPGELDVNTLEAVGIRKRINDEVLDDVVRLAEKLPDNVTSHKAEALDLEKSNEKLTKDIESMDELSHKLKMNDKAEIEQLNTVAHNNWETIEDIEHRTDKLSKAILKDAVAIRKKSEVSYNRLKVAYAIVFTFGWIISVFGIFLEGEEQKPKPLVEKLLEGV